MSAAQPSRLSLIHIFGRGQYPSLIEVCLWTATRQGNRFVSSMHMRTVGVVFGVDRHRVDAEFGCGADDSKRCV